MRDKLIASKQLYTFEEWYEIMRSIYECGLPARTTPEEGYEQYVAEILEKFSKNS